MSVEICAHDVGAYRGQKRVLDPLELELQAAVSHSLRCWEPNSGFL